jgi:hypothetical protein
MTSAPWEHLTDPAVVQERAQRVVRGEWPFGAGALLGPEWQEVIEALKAGDEEAIEPAIVFLEVDPYCLWTGFEKERLYGILARTQLGANDADRLRAFLLRRCAEKRCRHEFRKLRGLARALATADFLSALQALPRSTDDKDRRAEDQFLAAVAAGVDAQARVRC